MPTALRDLTVDTVAFVDRAAVRDPRHKSEPRRFLLWKADNPASEKVKPMPPAPSSDIPAPARAAVDRAIGELEPHRASDPRVESLATRLEAIRDAREDEPEPAPETEPSVVAPSDVDESELSKADRLADALVQATIAKAAVGAAPDDLPLRGRLSGMNRESELEYLRSVSPQGARVYDAAALANASPFDDEPDGLEKADDQLAYLRAVSPGAAAAYGRARAA